MVEISNIDAIIELIMREARARDCINPLGQVPQIKEDIEDRLFHVFDNLIIEEGREKNKARAEDWKKGRYRLLTFKRRFYARYR